jgi:hypothetical protein
MSVDTTLFTQHCSGIWILNPKETHKLEVAQMHFLRPLLGFTRLDHQRNSNIRERLKATNVVEEIQDTSRNREII